MAADVAGTMSGLFVRKYNKELLESVPPFAIIQEKLPVKERTKIGEAFVVPILLAIEHGTTFSKSGNGAFTLNSAVDGEVKQAIVNAAQHVTTSRVSYEGAASSIGEGTAVDDTIARVSKNNMIRSRKVIELNFLWGQAGLATVEAVGGAVPANTFQVGAKEWAGAIWAGMKNMPVTILDSTLATDRAISYANSKIVSINTAKRQVTLGSVASVVAGDVVFFGGDNLKSIIAGGSPTYHECLGLVKQLQTVTGTVFGLDYGANDVLQGNAFDAGDKRLTHELIQECVAGTMDHGNDNPKMTLFTSTLSWARANSDLSANRRYDASYRPASAEEGVEAIKYNTPIGQIEMVGHPFMKRGYAIGFSWGELERPGATDLTFNRAIGQSQRFDAAGAYFRDLETAAGYEMRSYHHSAIYCPLPSRSFVITNINDV